MNYLDKAIEQATGTDRLLRKRISFFGVGEALGAKMSVVNRETPASTNGIEGYNLEQAMKDEAEMTAQWAKDYCPDTDEVYEDVDRERQWTQWMVVLKDGLERGIPAGNGFNAALQYRRDKAFSDDYSYEIGEIRKLAESVGMPFDLAEAEQFAIQNRKGLREWIDRNGEEAVSRCLDALNPAVILTADELPDNYDDVVEKAYESAMKFAWKGAMKGIATAVSDLGALNALKT